MLLRSCRVQNNEEVIGYSLGTAATPRFDNSYRICMEQVWLVSQTSTPLHIPVTKCNAMPSFNLATTPHATTHSRMLQEPFVGIVAASISFSGPPCITYRWNVSKSRFEPTQPFPACAVLQHTNKEQRETLSQPATQQCVDSATIAAPLLGRARHRTKKCVPL